MKTLPISRRRSLPLTQRSLKYVLAFLAALIVNLSASPSFATNPLRYWAVAVGTENPDDAQLFPVIADIDPGEATEWYTGVHGTTSLEAMAANYEAMITQIGTYFNEGANTNENFFVTFARYVEGIGTYTRESNWDFTLTIGKQGLYIKGVQPHGSGFTEFDVDYLGDTFNGQLYSMADLFSSLNGLAVASRGSAEIIFMYLSEASRNSVIRRGFAAITRNIRNRLRVGPVMDALVHIWKGTGMYENNSQGKLVNLDGRMIGRFLDYISKTLSPDDRVFTGGRFSSAEKKAGYWQNIMRPLIVSFATFTAGAVVCVNWDEWLLELLVAFG